MGEVVKLQKKICVQVSRFGHSFEARYMARPPITEAQPPVQLYRDGEFVAQTYVTVSRVPENNPQLFVQLHAFPDEVVLFGDGDLGLSLYVNRDVEHLLACQEYVLESLAELIEQQLYNILSMEEYADTHRADTDAAFILQPTARQRVDVAWAAYCEIFSIEHEQDAFEEVAETLILGTARDVLGSLCEWFRMVESKEIDLPDEISSTVDKITAFGNVLFQGWYDSLDYDED